MRRIRRDKMMNALTVATLVLDGRVNYGVWGPSYAQPCVMGSRDVDALRYIQKDNSLSAQSGTFASVSQNSISPSAVMLPRLTSSPLSRIKSSIVNFLSAKIYVSHVLADALIPRFTSGTSAVNVRVGSSHTLR